MSGSGHIAGIRTISDLAKHPELPLGFSNEFLDRADCWPALRRVYAFPAAVEPRGLHHDLAYRALEDGSIAATDLYFDRRGDRVLQAARAARTTAAAFPEYRAVFLYRADLGHARPAVVDAIRRSKAASTSADDRDEPRREARRVPSRRSPRDSWPSSSPCVQVRDGGRWPQFPLAPRRQLHAPAPHARRHLARRRGHHRRAAGRAGAPHAAAGGQAILGFLGVIYTIPSLALLVFMIRPLGIGTWPAVVALYLYSLLPIVRTPTRACRASRRRCASRRPRSVCPTSRASAHRASARPRLDPRRHQDRRHHQRRHGDARRADRRGGYGEPILTGIRLDNFPLILEGAVPRRCSRCWCRRRLKWSSGSHFPVGFDRDETPNAERRSRDDSSYRSGRHDFRAPSRSFRPLLEAREHLAVHRRRRVTHHVVEDRSGDLTLSPDATLLRNGIVAARSQRYLMSAPL
jgi:osmoprotectant transport system permease protein